MSVQRTSYAKLQRDRAKKAKAEAKRARRAERGDAAPTDEELGGEELIAKLTGHDRPPTPEELLELVGALHARYDRGDIDFEEFEELKGHLLRRLQAET